MIRDRRYVSLYRGRASESPGICITRYIGPYSTGGIYGLDNNVENTNTRLPKMTSSKKYETAEALKTKNFGAAAWGGIWVRLAQNPPRGDSGQKSGVGAL